MSKILFFFSIYINTSVAKCFNRYYNTTKVLLLKYAIINILSYTVRRIRQYETYNS